jgi:L-asparaginase II
LESRRLAASAGIPSALHNNCSGKPAGFVCVACAMGVDARGYVGVDHPVQRAVRAAIEDMTGSAVDASACGTDGCSIPTYRSPLVALARGFARFGTGAGLAPSRAAAARRIRAAVAAHPLMVAGADRFDTLVMSRLGERVFCKIGAEGMYCAALPRQGLGVALKVDDGAARAAEVAMGALIRRFVPLAPLEADALDAVFAPPIVNWNGIRTGVLRPAQALRAG